MEVNGGPKGSFFRFFFSCSFYTKCNAVPVFNNVGWQLTHKSEPQFSEAYLSITSFSEALFPCQQKPKLKENTVNDPF